MDDLMDGEWWMKHSIGDDKTKSRDDNSLIFKCQWTTKCTAQFALHNHCISSSKFCEAHSNQLHPSSGSHA